MFCNLPQWDVQSLEIGFITTEEIVVKYMHCWKFLIFLLLWSWEWLEIEECFLWIVMQISQIFLPWHFAWHKYPAGWEIRCSILLYWWKGKMCVWHSNNKSAVVLIAFISMPNTDSSCFSVCQQREGYMQLSKFYDIFFIFRGILPVVIWMKMSLF